MWKSRISYGLLIVACLILMLVYSKTYLLFAAVLLILLAVCMAVLIRIDRNAMQVHLKKGDWGQADDTAHLILQVNAKRHLLATGGIYLRFAITNEMTGGTVYKSVFIQLAGRIQEYDIPFRLTNCGQTQICCEEMKLQDVLQLFCIHTSFKQAVTGIVYPKKVNLQVEMSHVVVGAPKDEGLMQNRKGNDPTEIFDIREYVPGDNIRSIHWKLSSKTDKLILREASEPFHYNVVILPDLGLEQEGQPVTAEEINAAVAVGAAIGNQLLHNQCAFCMAIPGEQGLHLCEVHDRREFEKMMLLWLGTRIPKESGMGLQYFCLEHMEQYFTRLLVLSAGRYQQNLHALTKRIGSTVVNVTAEAEHFSVNMSGDYEIIELPTRQKKETYRIIC